MTRIGSYFAQTMQSIGLLSGQLACVAVLVAAPAVHAHGTDHQHDVAPEISSRAATWDSDNFSDEPVASQLNQALSADWMPDGRLLVLGKTGQVYLVDPETFIQQPILQLSGVEDSGERGALDILVDPYFNSNRYFYVYYSQWPSTRLTIARFKFDADFSKIPVSRHVIWENPGPTHDAFGRFHIGGSLTLGPDDHFYLTVGDGFHADNAQNKDTVFGKVLRIDRDGLPATDNPFYDGDGPNVDEIWAFGLRNPYRASWDLGTGRFFIGDVGGNNVQTAYEEVNLGEKGKNYGWPLCEGPINEPKNGAACPGGVSAPIHYYAHEDLGNPGCCDNAAIAGGEIVRSDKLPEQLNGAYIYSDYSLQRIYWLTLDEQNGVEETGLIKATDGRYPVWLSAGPDGDIYYIAFAPSNTAELRRLRYTPDNDSTPPSITQVSASTQQGIAPLAVSFSAEVENPDNHTLQYSWDFGDGNSSNDVSPSHSYTSAGSFLAKLQLTGDGVTVQSETLTIQVGSPPQVRISSPAAGSRYIAGSNLRIAGEATDADGSIGEGAYHWELYFIHDNHTHPLQPEQGKSSFDYFVEDSGHDYSGQTGLRIILTVTDSQGLSSTATRDLYPQKIVVNLRSNLPESSPVTVDGIVQNFPYDVDSIERFKHTFQAADSHCYKGHLWTFSHWSNQLREPTLSYTVGDADSSLSAQYIDNGLQSSCHSTQVLTPGSDGAIRIEAEDAKITSVGVATWAILEDEQASAGRALQMTGSGPFAPGMGPSLGWQFKTPEQAKYVVWVRAKSVVGGESLYVELDGQVSTVSWQAEDNDRWVWKVSPAVTLSADQEYPLVLWAHHDQIVIDQLIVQPEGMAGPNGSGPAEPPAGGGGASGDGNDGSEDGSSSSGGGGSVLFMLFVLIGVLIPARRR